MSSTRPISLYRRLLAGVLAVLLGLGPIATPAYAAATALADQPLDALSLAKPNIVMTFDDSTSMLYDFLPDSVIGVPAGTVNYCRDATGKMNFACGVLDQNNDFSAVGLGRYQTGGYIYEQYGLPFGAYNSAFDTSGPGAGCDLSSRCSLNTAITCTDNSVCTAQAAGTCSASTPSCSGGISPDPTPVTLSPWSLYRGIERYPTTPIPPNGKSPKAGQAYEYWTFWPAPAHNSELNHAYYNPRLTYNAPLDSAGNSYPDMNAANTTNWTHVPADPWAATVQYVDLTAPVTVGLWCNSDWSVGHETDPAYCRTNGTGTSAATSSASTPDGDYSYPWAPPGIDPTLGTSTAQAIALSKVDINNSYALTPTWTTAQDPKFYYENDNILWCDATNPKWPQGGPPLSQSCDNPPPQKQSCNGAVSQSCGGGTPQACTGVTPQTCNNAQSQTCVAFQAQTCLNAVAQICNGLTPQTCTNVGNQTCGGISSQTCVGGVVQSCTGRVPQTCVGVGSQTCIPVPGVCNLPPPGSCTSTFVPPGCNLCSGECGTCTLQTTCPPGQCSNGGGQCQTAANCPSSGVCSGSGSACTTSADCAASAGNCSRDTGSRCTVASDCPSAGNCSATSQVCTSDLDCGAIAGHCSTDTGTVCADASACGNAGHCTLDTSRVCHSNTDCSTQPGQCSVTLSACFDNSQCPDANGTCSATNAACTSSDGCPTVAGGCNIDAQACTVNANCGQAGHCSIVTTSVCHDDGECAIVPGQCSVSNTTCTTSCPTLPGQCDTSRTACLGSGDCGNIGTTCTASHASCSVDTASTDCPTVPGTCSVTHDTCTDVSSCPPIPGKCTLSATTCLSPGDCVVPSPSASATCSDTWSTDPSTSLLADANDPAKGVVCRHNNQAYNDGTTPGPYNYPNNKYKTPVMGGTGPTGPSASCAASPRYATIPRHYWKTGVEWCTTQIAGAGDQWLGYGDPGGSCQDAQDTTHVFPRFYQFGQPASTANEQGTPGYQPAFQRIDLDSANPTATYIHKWTDDNGDESISRTFAGSTPDVSEMTNYANWFAYYRTRILAVKTVTSLVFKDINNQYRVGFHNLFNTSSFLNIADFDAGQKATWYARLFGINIPLNQQTPTLSAVDRIGQYYLNGQVGDLPGSSDPIQYSCQKNWHMLFTDGFTNQPATTLPPPLPGSGDVDDTIPDYVTANLTPLIPGLVPGTAWPPPFREDAPNLGASNSLSDYAMHYWITDLRPAGGPLGNDTDNVPTSVNDPAPWQHLNFLALSLGTAGKLPESNQALTESALRTGTLAWPQPQNSSGQVDVNQPDNSGVDDLWHAALNGRGAFVNAQTPEELALGLGQALEDALNSAGTRASVGFQGNTLGNASNIIYVPLFEPGWGGSLTKESTHIDTTVGSATYGKTIVDQKYWEASAQLAVQLQLNLAATNTPWFSNRKIVTMSDGMPNAKVPFLWGNLSASQQNSLAPGNPARGQAVLEYLRGNPTKEGTTLGKFRVRHSDFLGDIVNSSPVYVGPPSAPYLDSNDPGYSAFTTGAALTRAPQVYVGANDGMLHAFDDGTGNESWAYIPSPLFRGQTVTSCSDANSATSQAVPCGTSIGDVKTGLSALSYQAGALPPFRHHYYVDATPNVVDVNFAPGGLDWRTILVGGMGKGGNRYFALDITSPGSIVQETDAANKVLWEFPPPGDTTTDMGYTFGKAMIAKTHATQGGFTSGQWVVVVASGYNNPSGTGELYFLSAADGTLLTHIPVPGASGLAHISGYTQDFRNQLVDQVYAGDLLGNLWRFDLTNTDPGQWTVGLMATLDDGHNPQPVTTPPEIKIDVSNGIDRWVFVGTGKLYDDSDVTAPKQQQTMYAIRDGTATTPLALGAPVTRATTGMDSLTAMATVDFGLATKPAVGWYIDLPDNARIVVPPRASAGVVAFVGTKLTADTCLTGLPADVFALDYSTGQSRLTSNAVDATGPAVPFIASDGGGVGLQIVTFSSGAGNAGGASDSPDIRLAITLPSGETIYFKAKPTPGSFGHRMSWRLLGQ